MSRTHGAEARVIEATIRRFADEGPVVEALAGFIIGRISDVVGGRGGMFRLALAGGSTPRPLYERLAQPDFAERVPWDRIDVFWGDERCVPPDHAMSNYGTARESLLDLVPIPETNVHPVDCRLGPEAAATAYSEVIGGTPLDLVLLGMGGDGHTASLFPATPRLREETRRVIATKSPTPPVDRVSLSLRTINTAAQVVFVVIGEHKAGMLAKVLDQRSRWDPRLPAAMVQPDRGELYWFVDDAAAALLGPQTEDHRC